MTDQSDGIQERVDAAFALLDGDPDPVECSEAIAHLRAAVTAIEDRRAEGASGTADTAVAALLAEQLAAACLRGSGEERWTEVEEAYERAVAWAPDGHPGAERFEFARLMCSLRRIAQSPDSASATALLAGFEALAARCKDADIAEVRVGALSGIGSAQLLLAEVGPLAEAPWAAERAVASFAAAEYAARGTSLAARTAADTAMARHRLHSLSGDPGTLDEAIEAATVAIDRRVDDDPYLPEAQMQLATMLRTRYLADENERDLRRLLELSAAAVNSWYVGAGSERQVALEKERLLMLTSAVAKPGDWSDEIDELERLLVDHPLPEGVPAAPDEEAFHPWAAYRSATGQTVDAATSAEAAAAGTAMAGFVAEIADHEVRARWRTHLADTDVLLAERRSYFGLGSSDDTARLRAVARQLHADANEPSVTPATRFRALAAAAEVWYKIAAIDRDGSATVRAADTAQAAVAVAEAADAPHGSVALTIALARRANAFTNRLNSSSTSAEAFARQVSQIDSAGSSGDALLISDRQRGALAGEVALGFEDQAEASWTQLALISGLDVFDLPTRSSETLRTEERSADAAQVFVHLGTHGSRADVCSRGSWSSVQLPGLTGNAMMGPVSTVYRAYEAAGQRIAGSGWDGARRALLGRIRDLLAPLVAVLREAEAIEVYVSGWARAVPVVPVLSAALGHAPTVVEILPTKTQPTAPRDRVFASIASPGDPTAPLPAALDDAEEAQRIFNTVGPSSLTVDPSVDQFVEVLGTSTVVLFAGHGEASRRDPGDSAIKLARSVLTVGDLLATDLSHLELAILAACETMAPDGQIPERPMSLATAMVFSGAAAVVGSHWRVRDTHASDFALSMVRALAAGSSTADAYRAALTATAADGPWFALVENRRVATTP